LCRWRPLPGVDGDRPLLDRGDEDTRRAIFAATAQQLATRVRFLLLAQSR
jgi:hypothetical protein